MDLSDFPVHVLKSLNHYVASIRTNLISYSQYKTTAAAK